MKYIFFQMKSFICTILLLLMVGAVSAQTINISTSSLDGWSINNSSTFHVNTWSVEGNSDGSGMTTPFLENWVRYGNTLSAAVWSYTVTGLQPNSLYTMSALVRAYNERSNLDPRGVHIYAGDGKSLDISTGTYIQHAANGGTNTGRYATLTAVGKSDDSGNLTIGIESEAGVCNWVAMKNVTLTLLQRSTDQAVFYRVTGLDRLESGHNYMVSAGRYSYFLNGNGQNVSTVNCSTSGSFVTPDNENQAFTLRGSGSTYSLCGVGNNSYLYANGSSLDYTSNSSNWRFAENGTTYNLTNNNRAFNTVSLYERVSLSFPEPRYVAGLGQDFTEPVLTKHPADVPVTFESSNPNVASVSSSTGEITTYQAGTTVITATCTGANNTKVTASYFLVVKNSAWLSFWYSGELSVGYSYSSGYATNHTGSHYYTYNDQVVSVDADGKITAVGPGITDVTIHFVENNEFAPASASIQVTVVGASNKENPTLTLSASSNTVYMGQTLATVITNSGDGAVTYSSSNEAVATVSSTGVVTPVALGKVTIYAESAETANYNAARTSMEITVLKRLPEFELTAAQTDIFVGDTVQLYLTNTGNGAVAYSSSDASIVRATLDGYAIAGAEGKATITATSAETSNYSSATSSLSFTVNKRTATVTPSFTSRSLKVGNSAILVLNTASDGAQHFTTTDTDIVSVNASTGEITGLAEGTATVTYWIDASTKYNACAAGTVQLTVTHKPDPEVTVNPTIISMAIGATKQVVVSLGDYTGVVTAVTNEPDVATVAQQSFDPVNRQYVFAVTSVAEGETFLRLSFESTQDYSAKVIDVPINVLHLYQYAINVVNAPKYGVSVHIWGITYTDNTVFNSSRPSIVASDVNVGYLASYASTVTVSGRTITVTYSLKQPGARRFVRLRNYSCGLYATVSADGEALGMSTASMANIFYIDDDNHLLSYQRGQFLGSTNRMLSVADAASACTYTFTQGADDYSESFSIRSSEGKYLHGSASGTTTGTSAGSDYAYWYVEQIESLPVHISATGYGYATLYCPVALEIPGGVSAYYVHAKSSSYDKSGRSDIEYKLHLTPLLSVIPAATPVVLVGVPGTTYQCALRYDNLESAPAGTSGLIGSCATQVTSAVAGSGTAFALQPSQQSETVGFYPWHQTNLTGFKCYYVESVDIHAAYFRLVFGDEVTSLDADMTSTDDSATAVYNICGQKVGDSLQGLPAGIYVRGGKKIVVRK